MTNEDKDAGAKGGSSPNARRGERRSPPVIEGTAQELKDLSPSAGSTATDSPMAVDGNDDPARKEDEASEAATTPDAADPPADVLLGLDPPERVSPSGSGAIRVVALLLAVVAVASAGGIGWRVFNEQAADAAALRSQVATLETRVDAVGATKSTVDALARRVSTLEESVKAASSDAELARDDARKALEQANASRNAVEQATAQPAATAKSQLSSSDLAAFGERIDALEKRPDPHSVQTELAAQNAATDKKLTALGQSLASTNQRVVDLSGQLAAQAARLNPLEALLKAPKVDIPALEASNAKAVTQAQASALIVVARALQQAIDSGSPFATETAAAQKLGADSAQLQKLQPSAAVGAPTTSSLKDSFEPLAGPLLAGVDRDHANGLFGRLASGLGKLVRVSTIGQTSGDDRVALVGQIEGALARGDVAAALAARDRLPAPAQAITKDWAAQARTRVTADEAARALLNEAMDRLGKAPT